MEKHLWEMSLAELTREEGIPCSCGKVHHCGLRFFRAGPGAVETLPEALASMPYLARYLAELLRCP